LHLAYTYLLADGTFKVSPPQYLQLYKEQDLGRLKMEKLLAGEDPPSKRERYRDLDERLLTVVNDYENRDFISYLRGCCHNITL